MLALKRILEGKVSPLFIYMHFYSRHIPALYISAIILKIAKNEIKNYQNVKSCTP